MDIRNSDIIKKYNEAKSFINEYEEACRLVHYRNIENSKYIFDSNVWKWRNEIVYKQDYLKKTGNLDNKLHPYYLQIENRKRYIKEILIKKYKSL